MRVDLRNKPIAISGASSGIGAATALACARAGMPVALCARRLDRLDAIVAQIREMGGAAIAMQVDVTDAAACERFINHAAHELGGLYAVFANAGIGIEAAVHEMPDESLRNIFEINLFGSLNLIRPALTHLHARASHAREPRGHVLWCSSCLALMPTPWHGAYSATKSAQLHLGRAMRAELASERIEVSTVHPIGTKTEFFETAARASPGARLLIKKDGPFMQPSSTVASKVVGCLRSPKAAVWTGPTAAALRFAMTTASLVPNLSARVIDRMVIKHREATPAASPEQRRA